MLNEKNKTIIILGSLILISTIIAIIQNKGSELFLSPILLRVIIPFITLYYGYKAIKFFGFSSLQGKSIFFMNAALTIAWVGNIFWIIDTTSTITIANMLYIFMRPFFAFGIFYSITLLDKDFFNGEKLLPFLIFITLLAMVYFPLFFNLKTLASDFGNSPLNQLFLFFDFFLLAFAFLTIYFIYISFKGVYSQIWISFGIGTFCFWLSEMIYLANPGNYSHHGIIELGWALGFILFAFGFAFLRINAINLMEEAKSALGKNRKEKSLHN